MSRSYLPTPVNATGSCPLSMKVPVIIKASSALPVVNGVNFTRTWQIFPAWSNAPLTHVVFFA